MSMTRPTSALLLLSLLGAMLVGAAQPAAAEHICVAYRYSEEAGELVCIASATHSTAGSADDAPADDATGGDDAGDGSGRPEGCSFQGDEVPCSRPSPDGADQHWSSSLQCYVAPANTELFDEEYYSGGDERPGNLYQTYCPDGTSYVFWSPLPPSVVYVNPAVLAQQAVTSMGLRAIDIQMAPPPRSVNGESMGLVGLPVWLWTDPRPVTWGPQTASASSHGVSVSVTARVDRVEWNMGDGSVVTCDTPGTPYVASYGVERQSPDCGHVYERTSRHQPGQAYTVTATSYWVAEWSSGDDSGTISVELSTSERLRIGEMQALRVE